MNKTILLSACLLVSPFAFSDWILVPGTEFSLSLPDNGEDPEDPGFFVDSAFDRMFELFDASDVENYYPILLNYELSNGQYNYDFQAEAWECDDGSIAFDDTQCGGDSGDDSDPGPEPQTCYNRDPMLDMSLSPVYDDMSGYVATFDGCLWESSSNVASAYINSLDQLVVMSDWVSTGPAEDLYYSSDSIQSCSMSEYSMSDDLKTLCETEQSERPYELSTSQSDDLSGDDVYVLRDEVHDGFFPTGGADDAQATARNTRHLIELSKNVSDSTNANISASAENQMWKLDEVADRLRAAELSSGSNIAYEIESQTNRLESAINNNSGGGSFFDDSGIINAINNLDLSGGSSDGGSEPGYDETSVVGAINSGFTSTKDYLENMQTSREARDDARDQLDQELLDRGLDSIWGGDQSNADDATLAADSVESDAEGVIAAMEEDADIDVEDIEQSYDVPYQNLQCPAPKEIKLPGAIGGGSVYLDFSWVCYVLEYIKIFVVFVAYAMSGLIIFRAATVR